MTCGLKLVTMGAAILSVVKDRMSPSIPPLLEVLVLLSLQEVRYAVLSCLTCCRSHCLSRPPPPPASAHADSGALGRTHCLLQIHKYM